jgi:hypothetical protein
VFDVKYKVGDKVKIREGSLAGNIYTISHIESCRHIELSDLPYVFFDYELEPADNIVRMADGTIIGEFNTGGLVSIHDLQTDALSDWATNVQLDKETVFNGLSQVLKRATEVYSSTKEEKNLKFTFYVTEGTRPDKSPDGDGKGVIPTMTTEVLYKDNDGCANGGSATCDKADYNERQGCLEAIANAVLGGNFDREYEKFLADKKRKYNESCKCKICGRNYYEDEKTGKRTPFTPEDARKHEEWHEQNKKNKRERYLLRKRAKEIAFEEQAQKMAKEIIAENKKEAK